MVEELLAWVELVACRAEVQTLGTSSDAVFGSETARRDGEVNRVIVELSDDQARSHIEAQNE